MVLDMKRIMAVICALVFILNCGVMASAVTDIPDAFGNEYAEFDINADGYFDIRDLVRAKKYMAGMPTLVNLNFVNDNLSDAELLVTMRQALLKGGIL